MAKMRIFLADDHVMIREGLALLINEQADMEVIGQAGDGHATLRETQSCQPDVLILDISMPGTSSALVAAQLRQECPNTKIVVLTRHGEPGYVRQMLQAGAHGYVLKQADGLELLKAIRAVATGAPYVDTALAGQLLQQFGRTTGPASPLASSDLSERESDVVRLTAYGYSNKEIATQLGLSVKTIDTYKTRAMEKLGLHSRAALVRYALQRGWLNEN
jgi:DNA-binding NarL/FixJ family response regulator